MVVLITKWSWKGDVFIGSPGSSDEDIGVSSNAYCPANDPLGLAAQMTERESRGSEVASVLQVVTTRRRSMFMSLSGSGKWNIAHPPFVCGRSVV